MKGIVLDFNSTDKRGLIRGEDGERYVFSGNDINGSDCLETGATVDFDNEGNQAKEIYTITPSSSNTVGQSLDAGKEAAEKVGGFLKSGKIKTFISGGFDTICQLGAVLLPVVTTVSGFFAAGFSGYGFHLGAAIGGLIGGLVFGLLASFMTFGLLFTLIETRDVAKRTAELLENKK